MAAAVVRNGYIPYIQKGQLEFTSIQKKTYIQSPRVLEYDSQNNNGWRTPRIEALRLLGEPWSSWQRIWGNSIKKQFLTCQCSQISGFGWLQPLGQSGDSVERASSNSFARRWDPYRLTGLKIVCLIASWAQVSLCVCQRYLENGTHN